MKLVIVSAKFEGEWLLEHFPILDKQFVFKSKKFKSIAYKMSYNDNIFIFLIAGIGGIFSSISIQKTLSLYDIDQAILIGTAASIESNEEKLVYIKKFNILPESTINSLFSFEHTIYKKFKSLKKSLKIESFDIYSAQEIIFVNNYKHLYNESKKNNICFDMEASHIANLFKYNKIPFIVLKVITDSGKKEFSELRTIYSEKENELSIFVKKFLDTSIK